MAAQRFMRKEPREFAVFGDAILDEWGMRIGDCNNSRSASDRELKFYDSRYSASLTHEVFFCDDGKSVRHAGLWTLYSTAMPEAVNAS